MFHFQRIQRSFLTLNRFSSTLKTEYENILTEIRGKTALITLNRPKALNALSSPLLADVTHAARAFDANPNIGAIVITGSEKAFAAGADIKEMSTKTFPETYVNNMFEDWTAITRIRKPVSDFFIILIKKRMICLIVLFVSFNNSFRQLLQFQVMLLVVDVNLQ